MKPSYCKIAYGSPIVHIIITSHFTQNVNFVAAILIIVSTVYQARSIHFVNILSYAVMRVN